MLAHDSDLSHTFKSAKEADRLRLVKNCRSDTAFGDFDIAIGPSADGFLKPIFYRIDQGKVIGSDVFSRLVDEPADNHWGEQYCIRNRAIVDRYLTRVSVSGIDTNMSYPAPEVISEYVIGAFAEAHGMSVGDARAFVDVYGGMRFVEDNYKMFAYKMPAGMVDSLRRYIQRSGGECPPIVRDVN